MPAVILFLQFLAQVEDLLENVSVDPRWSPIYIEKDNISHGFYYLRVSPKVHMKQTGTQLDGWPASVLKKSIKDKKPRVTIQIETSLNCFIHNHLDRLNSCLVSSFLKRPRRTSRHDVLSLVALPALQSASTSLLPLPRQHQRCNIALQRTDFHKGYSPNGGWWAWYDVAVGGLGLLASVPRQVIS